MSRHLAKKHKITKATPCSRSARKHRSPSDREKNHVSEEEAAPECTDEPVIVYKPAIPTKQLTVESFHKSKLTLKEEMLRLICELNISLNEVASSQTVRRLLTRAYPSDPAPPKSSTTIRKYLREEATKVRVQLGFVLQDIRAKGLCLPSGFRYVPWQEIFAMFPRTHSIVSRL